MSRNNENEPISMACHLGSIASALTVPVVQFPKKTTLVSVKLMNGANIAASDGNYMQLQLKNLTTVIASLDTRSAHEGAVTANVSKAFNLLVTSLDALSDLTLVYGESEGVAEITRIVAVADVAGSLDQKSFKIFDEVGSVGFWIDLDNAGGTAPTGAAACARAVKISTINTGDTATSVATKLAAAVDADAKFIAAVDPLHTTQVVVTASLVGTRTDATDALAGEATGFTFSVDQQGVAVVAEALTNAKLVLDYFPL